MRSKVWSLASCVALAAGAAAPAAGQVVMPDGTLHYPQGVDVSRALTPAERDYLMRHPLGSAADAPTPAPTGPVRCAAEYEPMDGIIIAWEGSAALQAILADMARWITSPTDGNANLYVVCDSAGVQTAATSALTSAGAVMSRVKFVVKTLDAIWCRDYGPRYIYEGDCRAVVDHKYNRPRPNDDTMPLAFASFRKHAFYELGMNGTTLVHGGGNYHLDALDRSYATRLITNENPVFTEPQVVSIWQNYQGVNTHLFAPFPTSIDSTQHLDMWMQVIADDKVIVSDWPNNPGSTQDVICDDAAVYMAGQGYTVYRTPAFSISGVHYTFTNMVMCNDLVMIPSYTNATVAPHNAAALATLQSALPSKIIRQIPCQNIIGLAGAIHCIVMHVPAHRGEVGAAGGLAPTAYLRTPNGGESLTPGTTTQVRWISDDDAGVSNVDLLLSTDGGQTFPLTIAAAIPDTGVYNWTVPATGATQARIRVVTRDGVGNTGSDDSDADFTIQEPCYANCDGSTTPPVLNAVDFSCFLVRFAAADAWANCDGSAGEPALNVADFTCYLQKFAAGCP